MREKHDRPPNIVHIMWDDHSLGEVGIPEMNKLPGYDTPRINQMAQEGIADLPEEARALAERVPGSYEWLTDGAR
jgi:hypothetical protein